MPCWLFYIGLIPVNISFCLNAQLFPKPNEEIDTYTILILSISIYMDTIYLSIYRIRYRRNPSCIIYTLFRQVLSGLCSIDKLSVSYFTSCRPVWITSSANKAWFSIRLRWHESFMIQLSADHNPPFPTRRARTRTHTHADRNSAKTYPF